MSSSSSDEDDVRLRQIQEATSEQLRSAMKEKCDEVSSQSGNQSKLKLMRVSEQPSSHFELQTTPEFKCYVAKKLDEHLNSFLKDVEITSVFPKQDVGGGIRLLTSSTEFAAVDEDTCLVDKTPKRTARCRKSSSSSSEDDMEKFAAVCVSGQTILDGGEGVFKDNRSTIKNQTAHTAKRKRRKKDKADMDHVT